MRIPSDSELIAIWERAVHEHPVDRALTVLSGCSGESPEELAALSIGSRDAQLLEIYESFFGCTLDVFAECPACSEALEYRITTSDLTPSLAAEDASLAFEAGATAVRLRLPDSNDLRAIRGCTSLTEATQILMERCVVDVIVDEMPASIATLPEAVIDGIASRLAAANPHAEMLIDLTCPVCVHAWQVVFDIEPFLWSKISVTVKRLLQQVHTLASAYGWSEHSILTLSPTRRRLYTEMAGS